jgi:hypothetical protein
MLALEEGGTSLNKSSYTFLSDPALYCARSIGRSIHHASIVLLVLIPFRCMPAGLYGNASRPGTHALTRRVIRRSPH